MDQQDKKDAPGEETRDLKELCRVNGPFEADLIKNFLESHGIPSLVRGRTAPFVYPFTVDGLAEFRVFVQEKDFEPAKELLASLPIPGDEGGSQESG
jgi:hypothetical protein